MFGLNQSLREKFGQSVNQYEALAKLVVEQSPEKSLEEEQRQKWNRFLADVDFSGFSARR